MRPSERVNEDLFLRNRILDGDEAAAEELFQGHLDALYEFVHYRVGADRALAEDVVQDTMLVALDRLRSFDGHSTLHTWLCGIAKNKIRSHRKKMRPLLVEDLLEEADTEIDAILSQVESQPLPEWVLEKAETQELVGATLSSLPPDYRDLLVDKYLEGRSLREIAKAQGKSDKSTESMLHRARLSFGKVFQLLAKKRGGLL